MMSLAAGRSSSSVANAALIDVAFHVMSANESVTKIAMTLPSGVLAPSMMRFSVFSNIFVHHFLSCCARLQFRNARICHPE